MVQLMVALVIAGCGSKQQVFARTALWGGEEGDPVVLGAVLLAWSAFEGSCKKSSWYDDLDNEPRFAPCNEKPVALEVMCDGQCRLIPERRGETRAETKVIPLALGPLSVHLTSTRKDTGEIVRRSFAFQVVEPTRIAIQCWFPAGFELCGPEGVSAAHPEIAVEIYAGDRRQRGVMLRVNGRERELTRDDPVWSLAELFPDARDGDGVRRGTYTVELALGKLVERYQIVAR